MFTMVQRIRTKLCPIFLCLAAGCPMKSPNEQGVVKEGRIVGEFGLSESNDCKIEGYPYALVEQITSEDLFGSCKILQLCKAIEAGDCETVEMLIAADVDLSETGRYGVSAPIWAFLCGRYALIVKLVEAGAPVDVTLTESIIARKSTTFHRGDSLLVLLARHAFLPGIFFDVLPYSRSLNQRDGSGAGVIHHYVLIRGLHGDFTPGDADNLNREIGCFTRSGADLDLRLPSGDTPLHQAIRGGFYEIGIPLIENGADLEIQNADGLSVSQVLERKVEVIGIRNGSPSGPMKSPIQSLYDLYVYVHSID